MKVMLPRHPHSYFCHIADFDNNSTITEYCETHFIKNSNKVKITLFSQNLFIAY